MNNPVRLGHGEWSWVDHSSVHSTICAIVFERTSVSNFHLLGCIGRHSASKICCCTNTIHRIICWTVSSPSQASLRRSGLFYPGQFGVKIEVIAPVECSWRGQRPADRATGPRCRCVWPGPWPCWAAAGTSTYSGRSFSGAAPPDSPGEAVCRRHRCSCAAAPGWATWWPRTPAAGLWSFGRLAETARNILDKLMLDS